ncbi:MAG: ABC transporter permease [Propionibacteriaceae bacterium]|jgi:branched-chain amino acid transport system permease protein|nr:ABC transporter permease [Propionibacteriaceae bacterium]
MIDTLIAGLLHGNIYALIAVGMSLIFGVTHVANFAHGSIFAIGTMLGWFLGAQLGWGIIPTLAAVIVITSLLGWIISVLVVGPLAQGPPIAALLATIAVAMILDALSQVIFTPVTRKFPELLPTHNLQLGGVHFGTSSVVMLIVTIVSMAALWAFLRFGKLGQAIRATAQDSDSAKQVGIPVERIRHLSFIIASGLGGMAGIFMGLFNSTINPSTGAIAGLTAFVAATIGGLGSMPGAVLGGLLLGVTEAFGVYFLGGSYRDIIIFGALVLILLLRPAGLVGKKLAIETEPMTRTFLGGTRPIQLPWFGNLALIAGLAFIPILFGPQMGSVIAGVGTQVFAYAIAAIGLTIIAGGTGQIILGQAGAVAMGAYGSALLSVHYGWPFLVTIIAGALIAAVICSILIFPAWKLSGHYVAIATIGVGFITVALLKVLEPITRGVNGVYGIPYPAIFGLQITDIRGIYWVNLVLMGITLLLVTKIMASHLGKTISSIGADPVAAASLGIRVTGYKGLAYAISAFFAGLAGALLAHQYTYIEPGQFDLNMSTVLLAIIVLGGLRSPLGAVLGAIILLGVPELLRTIFEDITWFVSIFPHARIIVYGLTLILIIRFRPQGLFQRS